jgi:hypothetical protein
MQSWIAFALGFAGVSAGLLLVRRADARAARAAADRAAPAEPCWTEEIASDGRHVYGRSHCVNDELKEMDARVRGGDLQNPSLG